MLQYNDEILGHFVYTDQHGEWDIEIRKGNCLAVMIYLCKNEKNQLTHGLFNFYDNEKHIKNMLKENVKLCEGISNCTLNIYYKEALTILKYWSKEIEINVINREP